MKATVTKRVEGPIDYPITDEGFKAAIKKLNANKFPGINNMLKELIRIGKEAIKGHLVNLFIPILYTGKYPALWSFSLIVPIHKKDDRSTRNMCLPRGGKHINKDMCFPGEETHNYH